MNLIELATGSSSTEMKVVVIILAILACNILGIDAAVVLALILDGSDAIKYSELIKSMKGVSPQSDASTWALAMIGVGYPFARAYVKRLKANLIAAGQVPK